MQPSPLYGRSALTNPTPPAPPDRQAQLKAKAEELETVFLSQMLAFAGLDTATAAMGGGEAAGQFASFLRDAQAGAMVRAGGIGLSEPLFQALSTREGKDVA